MKNSDDRRKAFDVPTSVIQNTMNGQLWPEGDFDYHHYINCPTLLIHGSQDQLISVAEELEMKDVSVLIHGHVLFGILDFIVNQVFNKI